MSSLIIALGQNGLQILEIFVDICVEIYILIIEGNIMKNMFETMYFYTSDKSVEMHDFSHHIIFKKEDIVIIAIDMGSNRFQVDSSASGAGLVGIGLDCSKKNNINEYDMVLLDFDNPNDEWDIISAQTSKKTVYLTLIKGQAMNSYDHSGMIMKTVKSKFWGNKEN